MTENYLGELKTCVLYFKYCLHVVYMFHALMSTYRADDLFKVLFYIKKKKKKKIMTIVWNEECTWNETYNLWSRTQSYPTIASKSWVLCILGNCNVPFWYSLRVSLDDFWVQGSHPIDSMRANDAEICHVNLLLSILLHNWHASQLSFISWVFSCNFLLIQNEVIYFSLSKYQYYVI